MEPPLTTVDRVQRSNGMSTADAQLLDDLIREASDELAQSCNRGFSRIVGVVESVAGFGGAFLRLRSAVPLVSIASIQFDDGTGTLETVDAADYAIDDVFAGTVKHLVDGWRWTADEGTDITRDKIAGTERAAYVVTYTGGWISRWQDDTNALGIATPDRDLPYDIEGAIVDQVVTAFRKSGKDATVSAKKIQSVSTTFGSGASADRSVPVHWAPRFAAAVRRYQL